MAEIETESGTQNPAVCHPTKVALGMTSFVVAGGVLLRFLGATVGFRHSLVVSRPGM